MGTSNSVDELAKKLISAGTLMGEKPPKTVDAAARMYKKSVLNSARSDAGGDLRMSRWGKRGVTLNAKYEVKGSDRAEALLRATPPGPWSVLENGAKPHPIIPGLTRRQAAALSLFSLMAGQGGSFDQFDVASLAAQRRGKGNRNNRRSKSRKELRPLAFGGDKFSMYAKHPGVKGKRTWTKGVRSGRRQAIVEAGAEQFDGLMRVFR